MQAEGAAGNAIEKMLVVLDTLGEEQRLSEIVTRSGLAKSTVHRILRTFVTEGFAELTASGSYVPGPRMLVLAGRALGGLDIWAGADSVLERLQGETSATVHLAVRSGAEAVYVRKVEARKPYRMASRLGMSIPLHCTAIGKAILAFTSEDDVAAIAALTGLPARTTNSLTTLDALLRDLGDVRDRGWSIDDEENERGVFCAGAAIVGRDGRAHAAISVSQLVSDPEAIPLEVIGPLVARAATDIARSV